MIDWELRPLVGLGPLDFRMTRADVDRLLGPPSFDMLYSPTDYRQSRGDDARSYDVILGFNPDVLTDATFPSEPNEITILNHRIFHTDPAELIAILKQANGGFYAIYEGSSLAFEHLGVVLSDWMSSEDDDRWIAAGSVKGYKVMIGKGEPDKIVR